MKYVLLAVLSFYLLQFGYGQNKIDTSRVTVIPLTQSESWSWHLKNNHPVSLSADQLITIDSIIDVCILDHNNGGRGVVIVGRDIGIHTFKKQIIPSVNPKGKIIIWANCFSDDDSRWDIGIDWRKEVVQINDGGGSGGLFNLMIDLSTNKYYDLYVNGF